MNFNKLYYRLRIYCFVLSIIPVNGFSQVQIDDSLTVSDTSVTANKVSEHSLYSGIGYGSNIVYMGSTISGNKPFGYAALSYGFNSEFFATISAFHLADVDPKIAFYSGSLNYSHVFNSWFDISSGISGYKFAQELEDSLMSSFVYGDITLGFDWKLIYSKISLGGLISEESTAYVQLRNSRYFQTPEFFKDKVFISFDPYINLLFGTLIESETSDVSSSPVFGRWAADKQNTGNTEYYKKFSIMEIDFGLPVALNFERITVEAEGSYVMPTYDDSGFPGPKGFVFLLNCYFRIF